MKTENQQQQEERVHALRLSNQAVEYLVAGNPEKAINSFKQSLNTMSAHLRTLQQQSDKDLLPVHVFPFSYVSCWTDNLMKADSSNFASREHLTKHYFMFDAAIYFHLPQHTADISDRYLVSLVMALTMNTALAFLCLGECSTCTDYRSKILLKAAWFFNAAVDLAFSVTVTTNKPYDASLCHLLFLSVAALNNQLGITLEVNMTSLEGAHRLKDSMKSLVREIAFGQRESHFLSEFVINVASLDVTGMFRGLASPCA